MTQTADTIIVSLTYVKTSQTVDTVVTDTKYLCEQKPQAESICMIQTSASMCMRAYNVKHKVPNGHKVIHNVLTWAQRQTQSICVGTMSVTTYVYVCTTTDPKDLLGMTSNTKYLRGHNVRHKVLSEQNVRHNVLTWAQRQTQHTYVRATSDTTYLRGHYVRNNVLTKHNVRHNALTWAQRQAQRTYVSTTSDTTYVREHNVRHNVRT